MKFAKKILYEFYYSRHFKKRMVCIEPFQMNMKAIATMCKVYKRLYRIIREMVS